MAQDPGAEEVMVVGVEVVTEGAAVDTEVSIEETDRMLMAIVCCFVCKLSNYH